MNNTIKKLTIIACVLPTLFIGRSALACSGVNSMLGSMCVFAGNFAPRGYALAQGQLLSISSHTALFSILGTTYGGDGRTTFGLPDTRGRALIGAGSGPGLSSYILGQRGGAENVTLNQSQMPSHTHVATTSVSNVVTVNGVADLRAFGSASDTKIPAGNALAQVKKAKIYSTNVPNVDMHPDSIALNLSGQVVSTALTTNANNGGSQSHENRMPYITVNWIIALVGIFPSRS